MRSGSHCGLNGCEVVYEEKLGLHCRWLVDAVAPLQCLRMVTPVKHCFFYPSFKSSDFSDVYTASQNSVHCSSDVGKLLNPLLYLAFVVVVGFSSVQACAVQVKLNSIYYINLSLCVLSL